METESHATEKVLTRLTLRATQLSLYRWTLGHPAYCQVSLGRYYCVSFTLISLLCKIKSRNKKKNIEREILFLNNKVIIRYMYNIHFGLFNMKLIRKI